MNLTFSLFASPKWSDISRRERSHKREPPSFAPYTWKVLAFTLLQIRRIAHPSTVDQQLRGLKDSYTRSAQATQIPTLQDATLPVGPSLGELPTEIIEMITSHLRSSPQEIEKVDAKWSSIFLITSISHSAMQTTMPASVGRIYLTKFVCVCRVRRCTMTVSPPHRRARDIDPSSLGNSATGLGVFEWWKHSPRKCAIIARKSLWELPAGCDMFDCLTYKTLRVDHNTRHSDRQMDVESDLEAIGRLLPNLRNLYVDLVIKATSEDEKLALMDPPSG